MLCSKCSEDVKPVVAIDIDGTLGDYHGHFQAFAEAYLGVESIEEYNGSVPHREWFCATYGVDVSTFRTIKLAYRQGGMKRSMPLFARAPGLVRAIRDAGAEAWITTTRPWEKFDRVDPDTRFWLSRYGIPFDGLIYDDDKMTVLAERVDPDRVVFVLDDLVEVLVEADRLFPTAAAVLRRANSNRDVSWSLSVDDLGVAAEMAIAHVQSWHIDHHFDDLPEA